jgi:hypothetical protein
VESAPLLARLRTLIRISLRRRALPSIATARFLVLKMLALRPATTSREKQALLLLQRCFVPHAPCLIGTTRRPRKPTHLRARLQAIRKHLINIS